MRKLLSLLFAAMLAAQAWAQTTFEVDNLKYTVTDETNHYVSVGAGSSEPSDALTIHSTVTNGNTTYEVKRIANYGFQTSRITSLTIENGVTNIGDYAFNACSSLISVTIPNSVTSIGTCAFSQCHLTTITIPESVTSIGNGAFSNCSDLTIVTLPNSLTSISASMFNYCKSLTTVTIPNSVTSIGKNAFQGCSKLTTVTIPNSVTSINGSPFSNCSSLTEIKVEGGNTAYTSINGILFNKEKTILVCFPNGKTEMTITIPEPVTRIGEGAFEYCTNLRSVTISNSVTSIGATAFRNCSGLTSVTIPESVTSIGNSAFEYCSGLTTVTIPNSVTTIGINAFSNCSGLTTVTIPNSLTSIDRSVFAQCSRLTTVTIPSSVKTIGSYAFYQCNGLRSICFEGSIQPTYAKNTSFSDVAKSIRVCVPTDYTPNSWCGFTNLIKGHNKITDAAVAATCTETGLTEGSHCSYCGNVIVAQEVIAALGHNYGTPTYTWSADGKSCSAKAVCSRNSSHIVTEDASISSTVATAATCESKGKTKYTATFTNSRFATQTKTVTDIAALGHNYGTPTYTWSADGTSCSAKAVCSRNSSHTLTEDATITSAETVPPTCEGKGTTTYTATFTDSKFSMQAKSVVDIPALGHDFGTPTYTWSADGKSCSAKAVCSRNSSHIVTEDASISSTVATAATCESKGKTKYTATFTNSRFATQTKTVTDIAALGHNYGTPTYTWSAGGKSCSAKAVCSHNSSHTETEDASISSTVATAATCESKGKTKYTATFTNSRFATQTKTVTDIAALGHDFGTPTYTWSADGKSCSAKAVCSRNSSHTLTEDATITSAETVPPTCEGKGTTTYTATFTDSKFSMQAKSVVDIPALGHNYGTPTYTWSADGKSCSAKAVCSRNSSHIVTEDAAISSAVASAATCETKGKTKYTATFANSRFATQTKTVTDIAALGHNYGTPTYTWSADGKSCSAKAVCSRNSSHTLTEDATITSAETVPPTCEGKGTTTYTATFTDSKFSMQAKSVVDIPALGHDFGTPTYTWSTDGKSCSAKVVCSRNSSHIVTENASISSAVATAATCETKGKTKYTATFANSRFATQTKTVTDIAALGHTEVTDAAVAATCTEPGKTEGKHCSVCNAVLIAQEDIDALGHTEVTDAAKAPTCTETGLTEGKHCSVCNAVLVAQQNVEALGHTEVVDAAVAPTCTETGKTEGKHCSVCNGVLVAQETVAALGHTVVVDAAVAPTCTETGKTEGKHCSVCEAVLVAQEVIPAKGHSYDTAITSPTCTEVGFTTHTCSVCNLTYNSDTVPANGHTEVVDVAVAATCTEAGKTEGKHCSECNAVLVAQQNVEALGHTEVVDAAVAPTCTETGKTEGKHCSVCEAVLVAQEVIPAKGHSYDTAITSPTCTEVGFTTHTCSVCNLTYNSDTVPANAHTEVVDAAVAPTCTETGKTEGKHCSVCETVILAQEAIPALGHMFENYIFNNDATTEADGTETAVCERGCGATDTRVAEGTKLPKDNTAIAELAANAVNIYAHHNIIVVENADSEIRVYNAMGALVATANDTNAEIRINVSGVYVVRVGNTAKRVMISD